MPCARRFQCWHLDCFTLACARDLTASRADTLLPPQTKMDDKMNHLASKLNAGLIVALLTYTSGAAADEQDYRYTATLNDKGKYCARVKVLDYSGERKKTICRSLEAWQAMGYRIEKPSVAVSEEESDEKPA